MVEPSYLLKLARAREHLDSLDAKAREWVQTNPYGVVDEHDPEMPKETLEEGYIARRCRITRVSEVPTNLDIIVGECLFNLRSALDHIAFALAMAFSPRMTDDQIRRSQFPVLKKANAKEWNQSVGCIDPSAQAVIESLQPYQRGTDYTLHPLWLVHDLHCRDKHRHLAAVFPLHLKEGQLCITVRPPASGSCLKLLDVPPAVLVLDAILARWAILPTDPKDIHMNISLPLEIIFAEGGPAALEPVIPTLMSLCDFVADVVIPPLAKFL